MTMGVVFDEDEIPTAAEEDRPAQVIHDHCADWPIDVGSGDLAIRTVSPGAILAAVGPAVMVFQASAQFIPPNGVTSPVTSAPLNDAQDAPSRVNVSSLTRVIFQALLA